MLPKQIMQQNPRHLTHLLVSKLTTLAIRDLEPILMVFASLLQCLGITCRSSYEFGIMLFARKIPGTTLTDMEVGAATTFQQATAGLLACVRGPNTIRSRGLG